MDHIKVNTRGRVGPYLIKNWMYHIFATTRIEIATFSLSDDKNTNQERNIK